MIRKLAPYGKKYWFYILLAPLMIVAEVMLEIRVPYYMSKIVDVGIPAQDIEYIVKIGGMMMLMALCSLVFGVLAARFSACAGIGFGSELRRSLFDKVQEFSFRNVDRFSAASLVTRTTTDVTNTQNALMMILRLLVRAPVMLVSATIMAFTINPVLVRVFFVAIPVLAVLIFLIMTKAYPRFQSMLERYDSLNSSVQENLIAMRVVKAFVRSDYEKGKFKDANDALMNASMRAERVIIFNIPVMQLSMYGCIIAILWFGGNQIVQGSMLTGELISFISYVTQILMSLMMISMVFVQLVLSRASVSRILEVLEEKIDIKDAPDAAGVKAEDGSIEFEDVCFRYEAGENTIDHVSFRIKSGQTIGILGGTGSAKTSLVQLIPRLYEADSGTVRVGGHDVRKYKLEDLRQAVGMVLQKNVLFSGTIRENLKWGDLNATDEEIVEACEKAQADGFIKSFPNGYDTDLGQGGVNVSGGQKQRLCIARALLKKPKILILDDSTSAVDTATDAKIRQALRTDLKDTTKIIIAQRVSSVEDADQIFVMDDGRIVDSGTHQELLEKSEIYREVYESQQKGVEENA